MQRLGISLNDGEIIRSCQKVNATLEAAKSKVLLPLSKFDLSLCFEQAAKRDWPGALAAAQSIESKALRSQAYIAACRNVL